jgi:zinc protease
VDQHLSNGLRVIVEPVQGAPVVSLQVWVGVGSLDEQDGEHGLAHLHEHMLFKGTPSRGVGEIAASIERVGGELNAFTSHDHTCYYAVVPSHAWRTALQTLADAVSHSLFDADELTREIEVVVEEIKRAADTPGQVAWQKMFAAALAGHPYARPILGSEESVRSMTRERMLAFYGKHYVAPNMTVVVAGDVDPADALAEVKTGFATLPVQPPPPKPAVTPPQPPPSGHIEQTSFSESRLLLAWAVPPLGHADVPALDLLAIVLGQGDSSRLVRHVQREQMLANDIGASSWTPLRAGLFAVTALSSADRLAAVRSAVLREVQRIRDHGVDADELDKARHNVLAEAVYKHETVQGLAQGLGYFAASLGDPHWDRSYARQIEAVRREDIQRVAQTYLTAERLHLLQLCGEGGACDELSAAVLAESQALLLPARQGASLPGPRHRDIVDGIERIQLPSGDVLVVQPDRSVPVFGLRASVQGGLRGEDPSCNGRTYLLGQMLTRGTARRSADAIAREVETLAAGLSGSAGRNSLGLQASGLSASRDALLDLFFDALFESVLPQADLDQERAVQLEDLRHQIDAPARQALRAMAQALYGAHPYAMDLLGHPDSVQGLQRDALLAYVRGRLAPGRLVYAAAGDIDPDELAAAIVAHTPDDRAALPPPPRRPIARATAPRHLRRHIDKQQAHIAVGYLGACLEDPARYALDVLATVLSGQSGRLFLELRDRQSLAYSVSAMHVEGLDEGYFALYLGTSPDKVEQGLRGLAEQVERLRHDRISDDELDRARQSLAGSFAIGLQRRSARATTLGLNELYGLGRQAYRGQVEALLAVTADDVLRAARVFLDPATAVEVVHSA